MGGSASGANNHKLLSQFTAAAIIKNKNTTRASYTALLVKDLKPAETNVRVRFADPSGEISGTVHKKVVDEYVDNLRVGSVLVMKKVALLVIRLKSKK